MPFFLVAASVPLFTLDFEPEMHFLSKSYDLVLHNVLRRHLVRGAAVLMYSVLRKNVGRTNDEPFHERTVVIDLSSKSRFQVMSNCPELSCP